LDQKILANKKILNASLAECLVQYADEISERKQFKLTLVLFLEIFMKISKWPYFC